MLRELYRDNLALLTDLYELTMAYGYWKADMAGREAVFHLSFRTNPFQGGYTLAAGLGMVVEYLERFAFEAEDIAYLASLKGNDGDALFEAAFLEYLREWPFRCTIDAMPEGTVVFPFEPLVRVQGPVLQAQILEPVLLNIVNFQSLIATKAARTVQAARGDPVIEFGLRRAQGIDGALSASRAAFIGGCAGTSNVLAGRYFGMPVKGTLAHSWVMAFDSEPEAFDAYARALPNNCIFLVDTYDTLQGVRNAVEAGRRLRAAGHVLAGIRLDSGDLAYLSVEARKLLDDAGFRDTAIVASNELDEGLIANLKEQGAAINVWGVGTRLVTGHQEGALGGIYKLSAIRAKDGAWKYRVKLSEQALKTSVPGIQQVRRFSRGGEFQGDMIYDIRHPPAEGRIIDPTDLTRQKSLGAGMEWEDLLVRVFDQGRPVRPVSSLASARDRAGAQLAALHPGIRRFRNPHAYPVGLDPALHAMRTRLIFEARGLEPEHAQP